MNMATEARTKLLPSHKGWKIGHPDGRRADVVFVYPEQVTICWETATLESSLPNPLPDGYKLLRMHDELWTQLEQLARQLLNLTPTTSLDMVEDLMVSTESDEGGETTELVLEGDLVLAMLRYLATTDQSDPQYNKLRVQLDGHALDQLKGNF